MTHIFLMGFMGSGKTTIGRDLSEALSLPFHDLDEYIEQQEGSSIAALFENKGEEIFRRLERNYLEQLIEKKEPSVIALGGGTPCFGDNLQRIKTTGITVFLDIPAKELYRRLSTAASGRPLLKGKTGDDLERYIINLLNQRQPFYSQADISFDGVNGDIKALAGWVRS